MTKVIHEKRLLSCDDAAHTTDSWTKQVEASRDPI